MPLFKQVRLVYTKHVHEVLCTKSLSHKETSSALFLPVAVPLRLSRFGLCHFYANKLLLATPHPSYVYTARLSPVKTTANHGRKQYPTLYV